MPASKTSKRNNANASTAAPQLGNRVRDIVTGFEGTCASIHNYLHGCTRIGIEPNALDKDGKPVEPHVFDIQRVEVLEESAVPHAPHVAASVAVSAVAGDAPPPGGPRSDPVRRSR